MKLSTKKVIKVMVINRKFTVKRSLFFLTSLVLGATPLSLIEKPAFAGCGWGDITCDPRNWDRPPIPIPGSSGGSTGACTQSVIPPRYREFILRNNTQNRIIFRINNQEFALAAGQGATYKTQITTGSSSGCGGGGQSLGNPVVSFDDDYSPGFQRGAYQIPENRGYYFATFNNGRRIGFYPQ